MSTYSVKFVPSALISLFVAAVSTVSLGQQAPATKQNSTPKPQSKSASELAKPAQSTGDATPAPAPATPPPDPGANLPPDTPVITLTNVCSSPSTPGECKTVITKAEFEKLVTAGTNQTSLAPSQRTRVVQPFAQTMLFDAAAEKQGLEKQPQVEALLKVARMSALAKALQQEMVQKAQQVTPEQIDQYYKQHEDEFEEAKVERLFVPRIAAGQNVDQAKAKALADRLQKEAAAGKSFEELQKQVYTELGITQTPPTADMGVRRRNAFSPAQQQAIFSLAPGKVSDVLEDPAAFYIYKLDSKTTVPLESVSNEIKNDLARKSYEDEVRSVIGSAQATLNPDYFDGMKTLDWNTGTSNEREREVRPAAPASGSTGRAPASASPQHPPR